MVVLRRRIAYCRVISGSRHTEAEALGDYGVCPGLRPRHRALLRSAPSSPSSIEPRKRVSPLARSDP